MVNGLKTLKPFGVRSLLMKKNLITIGIVVTGVLSILLTLLTYYGSYSGNFIVIVDTRERISSILLSETEDLEEASPRLFADSVNDSPPLAYYDIKVEEAVAADGNYVDPDFKYFAYSFYLINNGNQILDVEAKYLITDIIRDADKAIRVIIVKNEDIENMKMFMKKDKTDYTYPDFYPEATVFEDIDNGVVFTEVLESFKPQERIKYTVINYVEGLDPDCDDSISGGLIKMTFRFTIMDHEES